MKNKILLGVGVVVILVMAVLTGCTATAPSATVAGTTPVSVTGNSPVNVNVGSQQTGIWVNGEGTVTVVPDLAILNLGVSTQTSSVKESQAQAAAAMDKVIAALKANGVAEKDIQTQYFNISQVTRYDNNTQQTVVTGYNVSNTVVAKLRDIAKVGNTIDAVVEAGGDFTRFNGINFSVEKPEQYYSQARELAIADAKAKADQMAKLTGVTLGPANYVSESTSTPPTPGPIYFKDAAASGSAVSTSISAGQMEIILNVQIAYSIR